MIHLLLDDVPNVTLVDELVSFRYLLHHFEDKCLAVAGVQVETRVDSSVAVAICAQPSRASRGGTNLSLLTHESAVRKNALLADAMGNENLKQVVRYLVKLFNLFDVSAHDCLLLLKNSDGSVNLDVHQAPKSGKFD